jgi:hypothetical protein
MQPKRSLLVVGASVVALICMGASSVAAPKKKSSDEEMQQEIQALRDQVNALQRRLDAQSAAQQQTQAQAESAAAQAASAKAQAAAIPAQVQSQVKTAVEAAKPNTDKLHYKGVTITLGGYGALESVFRTHNEAADIGSSFSAIPYPNSSVGQTQEFRFSARQSRISALAQGDVNPQTHLAFYGEFDFLGAAQTANSNESNSYTPRIRNLYNTVDWDDWGLHLLLGQNWSLVTLNGKGITPRNEVPPPVIDAQYVPGFDWARQPQFRITKDFDKQVWLALSLENPQTTFYTGANALPKSVKLTYNEPAGAEFNSANTLSLNHIPDVIAKIAYEPSLGDRTVHLEAYGLYRDFYSRLNFVNQDTSGGGFGAGVTVSVVPKILDLQVSGLGGKGIGRYGSAQLPDVTFDQAGNIRPIHEIQALVGLTLHATPELDVYAFAGEEKESAQPYYLTAGGKVTGYGYGNPLYSNSGCQYENAPGTCVGNTRVIEQATAGFWYKPWVGAFGRYQWGLQYSLTERKAFFGAGVNGVGQVAPVGNDSMVFASFRYYPF